MITKTRAFFKENWKKFFIFTFFFIALLMPNLTSFDEKTWNTIWLFLLVLIALILKPFSMGEIGIFAITIGSFLNIFDVQKAISAFGMPISWQIVAIFFIARGFVKTGLSKRISYYIINFFGHSPLGLAYGISSANLVMGPLIPSSTARIGGILFPIVKVISELLGSSPEKGTQKKIGSFLAFSCLFSNAIVSSAFLTAMAGNLIIQKMAAIEGVELTWGNWFLIALIPGAISLILMPLLLNYFYKPDLKDISKIRNFIIFELKKLGPLSFKELQMLVILISLLAGWMFSNLLKIEPVLISFFALSLLLLLGIIDYEEDLLTEKEAWNCLIWFSCLILLTQQLIESNVLCVIIDKLGRLIIGYNLAISLSVLVILYGYTHYFFASNASHLTAMYPVFLGLSLKIGAPPILAALLFAFGSSLFGGLATYSSTEAVIISNSEYISQKDMFKIGFIMTTCIFCIWMFSGVIWWKILGLI